MRQGRGILQNVSRDRSLKIYVLKQGEGGLEDSKGNRIILLIGNEEVSLSPLEALQLFRALGRVVPRKKRRGKL